MLKGKKIVWWIQSRQSIRFPARDTHVATIHRQRHPYTAATEERRFFHRSQTIVRAGNSDKMKKRGKSVNNFRVIEVRSLCVWRRRKRKEKRGNDCECPDILMNDSSLHHEAEE